MTFPVEFTIGAWSITAHQLLESVAYVAGFQLYLHLRRTWPKGPALPFQRTMFIVIGALSGALAGAKLLAWGESYSHYWAHREDWRALFEGKTIVGALLGGWLAVEAVKRRLKITHYPGDIYVFPVILGLSIGRIGCFLQGLSDQTYGTETSLPWGVDFGDGIPRHPTQLYEVGFLLALAILFAWRRATGRQRGCMFGQFMGGYLGYRFLVEFIKPRDVIPWLGLSAIQLAALGGLLYAFKRRKEDCCAGLPHPSRRDPEATGSSPEQTGARLAPQESRFLELTSSLCALCLDKVDAKVVEEAEGIYLRKFCPKHGPSKVLIANDREYWKASRAVYKAPTAPLRRNTQERRGCPWDCGLCPAHEQHCCLAIVEVTDHCDQACPICYACSTSQGQHRTLAEVRAMLDAVVANEGTVAVVQLSGGEPTLHPQFFEIIEEARQRPIRHLMINTNGQRIANDPEFVERLAAHRSGIEVYLQFDSLMPAALRELRGADLRAQRRRALAALDAKGISTTLVVTLKKGVNDGELGAILDFAIEHPCIRGVVFQPIQAAGRLGGFAAEEHRLTLTEVRQGILAQHSLFSSTDLVPVPCHTDALAMGYAVRMGQKMMPLSQLIDPASLLALGGNTISYEQDGTVRQRLEGLFSAGASPTSAAALIQSLCCGSGPGLLGGKIDYSQVFRVVIMQFMDAHSMDLRSLKRSCVQIVSPEGRLIPFDTYNLLHRGKAHD